MPTSTSDRKAAKLRANLAARSKAEGFAMVGVAPITAMAAAGQHLQAFVDHGYHGEMDWMVETLTRRQAPQNLWAGARSALIFAMPYGQGLDPMARLQNRQTGVISTYALNRDYHELVKGKLKHLASWFARTTGAEVKVFVDTAPLMEKPLAALAGLGWQGKHTNLVSRQLGSWFFLGAILTSHDLPADEPETDHCGSCRACLDICPTAAFPAPGVLDARRCISYLTIEHKGHIAEEFRKPMGNRIYGCDDCLAVCPWNKFATAAADAKLVARPDLLAPPLGDLLKLDDIRFRQLFSGSPVKRIGRHRFIRNVLIAAGNSGDESLIPIVRGLLADPEPQVRAMAVWALFRLEPPERFAALANVHSPDETDDAVRAEWMRT